MDENYCNFDINSKLNLKILLLLKIYIFIYILNKKKIKFILYIQYS